MDKPFVIKIEVNVISLNESLIFPLSKTNLDGKLIFTPRETLYFKVAATNLKNGEMSLNVLNYSEKDKEGFIIQLFETEINFLKFENLDWNLLEPILSSYSKIKLEPICINLTVPKEKSTWSKSSKKFSSEKYSPPDKSSPLASKDIFTKNFEDITFNEGYVSFTHQLSGFVQAYELRIENSNLRSEFNYIKDYFIRHFKSKKISVEVSIVFLDSGTVVSCISPEISSINSEVIESVKVNRTLLLKNIDYSSAKEQTIYSSDELFAMLNKDSSEINVFNQSADEIINELLNQNDIRNKEQLIFLSKEMQSDKSKIHFTLKPIFGFLFLHEAKGKQHYIWELLNSHATYIWSINNPEQSGYWEIENELNIIRQSGRQAYRNAEKKDLQKKGLNFKVISHKLKAHSENSGFLRWKEALNEALK